MLTRFGFLSVLVPLCFLSAVEAPRAAPPNIIFLLTDDQRWDTLGINGNPIIATPHLDGLGRRGVVLDNMFVTTSICAPNRASILTGQYVSRHGIWDFRSELSPEQLEQSYLGLLKRAGYRLGFIGKWGVGQPPEELFDYVRAFAGQGRYFVEVGGQTRHLTSVMGDQALEFLESSSSQTPFCLSVSFKAPHVQDSYDLGENPFPFDPDLESLYADVEIPPPRTAAWEYYERLPRFLKDSENRMRWAVRFWGPSRYQESVKGYYRLITGVDRVVGQILEKLQEKGWQENTILVFTSDNGFFLGEYGFAGKWYPHEASIRVPLLIYDPRLPESRRGRRLGQMALSIDLAPTLLELAGLPVPAAMQGQSLLPLLRGEEVPWRKEFFYEHRFEHPRIPPTEGIRTEEWKYILYVNSQPLYEELYHLRRDPLKEHNLASSPAHGKVLERMRALWKQWRQRVRGAP